MRIKKRLQINVAVSVLTALVICLMLFMALHRVNRAMEASSIADEIVKSVFERSTFREDYLRTNSDRAKVQWFARHEQIGGLLKSAAEKFTDSEDKKTVDEMIRDHETTGKLFTAIVKNRENAGSDAGTAALSQEIENRLLTQLIMRLYDKTLNSSKLQNAGSRLVFASLRQAGWGIVGILTIVIAVAVASSWTMSRAITDRVRRLRDGAAVIGEGDLDHHIGIKGDDEFAELSEAFNAMTARLRGTYHNLEKEIEERKQAEGKLWKTAADLKTVNTELDDSRRAAINLMEDALDARGKAEQAAERLRVSEERYRALTSASSDVIYRMNPDWSEMFHLRGHDFIADTEKPNINWLQEYIHPDDQPHVMAVINEAIRTRSIFELEHRVLRVDGTLGWTFSRAVPLLDASGKIVEWFGAASDITERKRAVEALQESERKYSILFDTLAVAASLTKLPEIVFSDVNKAFEKLFGYTRDEVVGKTSLELGIVKPEEHKVTSNEIERQGRHVDAEKHVYTKSGEERIVLINVIALELSGQNYALTTMQDITERKRVEEALSKSEMKFRGLFNWMGEAIQLCELVWDEQGQPVDNILLDVNPAYEKETGLTREQVVGRRISEILPVVEQVWLDRYGEVLRTRKPIHFEEYNASVDRWFDVFASPMEGNQFAVVFGNITDRKRAEEQIKAALTEKDVMLREIHHRVKNNLQVISSLVSLQVEGTRDETVREVLRDVTYRVRSMALVHEKLYQTGDLACIDFAEYAKSLLNYLWRAHGSTAAPVRLTFDLESVSLPVDTAVPCGLILNELAGNALKHAFRGRDAGEVAVSLQESAEGRVSLSLRDNGVGLPAELDWRQARSLGLRLVQMLAGQLNATVEVSGTDGTKFEITFMQPEEKSVTPPVLPLA